MPLTLLHIAPTTASRSPSPARAGEAWLRSVFSQNHAILASPADAGERSTSANHTSFYSCSWDVFPYDLFPVQLCPMGLLLGQVSKWRAQRADGGICNSPLYLSNLYQILNRPTSFCRSVATCARLSLASAISASACVCESTDASASSVVTSFSFASFIRRSTMPAIA